MGTSILALRFHRKRNHGVKRVDRPSHRPVGNKFLNINVNSSSVLGIRSSGGSLVKIKLSLWLVTNYLMKIGGREVILQLNSFLISVLHEDECLVSGSGHSTLRDTRPWVHFAGAWVGLSLIMDVTASNRIPAIKLVAAMSEV
jgi:hypothetical protein